MKYSTLTKLTISALFLLPMAASAEHMDVIENEFINDCTPAKYQAIVNDFNAWAKDYGYVAKIAYPTFSNNLESFYWLGTSKDGATFGAAYDAWLAGLKDPKSTPSKLNDRFSKCTKLKARRSYTVN